ncbi:unnamed protein product [Phyllotreta striolata]|uniref:Sarcospan n=1 Tax=Phyllotreta striolata TaxID=444603 RepID=A0A9N9XJB4_PHYSR|nr:unnamed protein product [Phyllotreta striolata]
MADQPADLELDGIRPVSFYDNKEADEREQILHSSDEEGANRSQINFLNTTVPQNIMAHDIIGKHTPTRNSLRHSRLITLNRSGQVPIPTSTALPCRKLAKVLLAIILIVGLELCIESLWLLLWTPNLKSRDNPGWCGIPVLVSSFAGILFISSVPDGYSDAKFGYWRKSLKYITITVSAAAAASCVLIIAFSSLHLMALFGMTCAPPEKIDSTCLCRYNSTEEAILDQSYHYADLSCKEVRDVLSVLIMVSCAAGCVALISEAVYLYLHWASRNACEYSRVPMNALNIHKTGR